MKVVIIEDEELAARDLADTIEKVDGSIEITAILYSVEQAVSFFTGTKDTDLIFSDIQLGDGLSFDIFQRVSIVTPVIFCTAYDEYALKAFKANGIDYVLKPFTMESIKGAIVKYKLLKHDSIDIAKINQSLSGLIRKEAKESSVVVYFQDRIIPIKTEEIGFFYVDNDVTYLVTFDQKKYTVRKSLEELEGITGQNFYRANRKTLINRHAIKDASPFLHRKLVLNLDDRFDYKSQITISKLKVTDFLRWLRGMRGQYTRLFVQLSNK